jgi:hypothetical protein
MPRARCCGSSCSTRALRRSSAGRAGAGRLTASLTTRCACANGPCP